MQAHEYFPGGNTPAGFYSYYEHINPQDEARKTFILKGGPGTGKSSLMKKVAQILNDAGYAVDLLHCSSDPDSLDAIVSQKLGFCMLDGTAPHIVDPKTPGAVDCIINLGEYWDAKGIEKHKADIMTITSKISGHFASAYDYLKAASCIENHMEKQFVHRIDKEKIRRFLNDLIDRLNLQNDTSRPGKVKKAFLSAFTPKGNICYIDTIARTAKRVIRIDAAFDVSPLLTTPLSNRITESGKDAVFFYCPMRPDVKIEHIYLPAEHTFITTKNAYHTCSEDAECVDLSGCIADLPSMRADIDLFNILLSRAGSCLKQAKEAHDILERYYIPYMDFNKMADLPQKIASQIL